MVFSAPPIKTPKKRSKKSATPVVESDVRRCTRSLAKKDGFRAGNLFDLASPLRRRGPEPSLCLWPISPYWKKRPTRRFLRPNIQILSFHLLLSG